MVVDPTVAVLTTVLVEDEVLETLSCGHVVAWDVRFGIWSRAERRRCRICGEQAGNHHAAPFGQGEVKATDQVDHRCRTEWRR
jgi:hypothetical protein